MEFLSVSEFFNQENEYRHNGLKRDAFDEIMAKYCVDGISYGWYNDTERQTPDLRNESVKFGAPDIRGFFDHPLSIRTEDGEVFWVVRTYDRGYNMLEVMRMFRENGIQCDVMKGFYADYTIIMRPFDVINACIDYKVLHVGNNFDVTMCSKHYRPQCLERFDNYLEAKGFVDGVNYALKEIAFAETY